MKKKIIKRSIFVIVFLLLFCFISELFKMCDSNSTASIEGFYKEPKNSIDVICIGASDIYTGYIPTQAFKEHGYTSYDLCIAGAPGNIYKSMLIEALKRQSPKVVVFELNGFIHDDAYFEREEKIHSWIDGIPWSDNRIQTIKELVPKEKQKEYYFPFLTYHSNWKHPKGCLYRFGMKSVIDLSHTSNLKGYATLTRSQKQSGKKKKNMVQFTERSRNYMIDLLEYCKESGLQNVLFTRFPHGTISKDQEVFDEIEALVTSYGYDFVNAEQAEMGIDFAKDFYNKEHMNYYGAKKMTAWFGSYLVQNYDIKNNTSKDTVKRWTKEANKADKVLAQCKEDLDQGIERHYSEASIYMKMPQCKPHKS